MTFLCGLTDVFVNLIYGFSLLKRAYVYSYIHMCIYADHNRVCSEIFLSQLNTMFHLNLVLGILDSEYFEFYQIMYLYIFLL